MSVIGLTLAGALFLRPRFNHATQTADAAAIQTVTNITGAIGIYSTQEGAPVLASGGSSLLYGDGYLDRVLKNPIIASEAIVVTGTPGGSAGFVFLGLGPDADSTCATVTQQSGRDPDAVQSPTTLGRTLGCFRKSSDMPVALTAGPFYAFA